MRSVRTLQFYFSLMKNFFANFTLHSYFSFSDWSSYIFTLYIVKNFNFIRWKRGFLKLKPLNEQYRKYPTAHEPIKVQGPPVFRLLATTAM